MADPNLAQLMQLPGATNPANPIPSANPVQAAPQDPLTQSILGASQLGQQTFQGQLGRMHGNADQVAALQQQMQQAAGNAPRPWTPSYQPMTGQGAGGDVKGVIGNLGRALLQGLSFTGPGSRVEQEVYRRQLGPYEEQQRLRAQQIQELQTQQGIEEKPLEAAAQLQYRPYMAQAAVERGQAAMLNATNKGLYDKAMVQLRQAQQQIEQDLGNKKITVEQARTKAMELIAANHDAVMREIEQANVGQREAANQLDAAETQYKTENQSWLQRLIGTAPPSPLQVQPTNPTNPKGQKGKTPGRMKYNPATGRLE